MRRGGGQHNARRGPKPPPAAASASPTFESLADEAYQLSERAERRRGDQADELLAQCIALYQQALVLNPQHLDTRYNLAHAMYSRAKVTKSQDLARNLLVAAAEQFSLVFQADQSRLFPLYLAAIVYILLGDRLDAPQQKFQAYNTAADGFARLFALLPPPSEAAPPIPADARVVPLPETRDERIEREVMEALLQSETVSPVDALTHWGEALAKKADVEPNLAAAQAHYAQAYQVFQKLVQLAPHDPEAIAAYVSVLIAEAQRLSEVSNPQALARALELLTTGNALLSQAPAPLPLPILIVRGDLSHAMAPLLSPSPMPALQEATQFYSAALEKLRMSPLATAEELGELHAKRADVLMEAHKALNVAGESPALVDAIRGYEESVRLLAPLGYADLGPIVYNYACTLALAGRAPQCEQQLRWLAAHSPDELSDALSDSDFDRFKGEAWFAQLVRGARR